MYDIILPHIRPIVASASKDFALFKDKLGARMSAKLQSEIMSALLENAIAKYVPNARCGAGDHEADVYVDGVPLEIKTAFRARSWRGGEYSKRSGDFLLVSWDMQDTPSWCVLHATLSADDWQSSGSANYYATSISLDDAMLLGARFLIGGARQARVLHHPLYETVRKSRG